MTFRYYEVPLAVLERPDDLVAWAKRAIAVAACGQTETRRPNPDLPEPAAS